MFSRILNLPSFKFCLPNISKQVNKRIENNNPLVLRQFYCGLIFLLSNIQRWQKRVFFEKQFLLEKSFNSNKNHTIVTACNASSNANNDFGPEANEIIPKKR